MGRPFKTADGKLWRQAIELPPGPDGKRRKKFISATRKSALIPKVREFEATLYRSGGTYVTTTPTMAEWVTDWIERGLRNGDLRPKTAQEYRGYNKRYIIPSVGQVRIGKMTPAHVRRVHAYIEEHLGLSPSTALQAHNIVSGALKAAVFDGIIPNNPAERTKRPRRAAFEAQTLSLEQARQFLAWAGRELDAGNWWAIRIPIALYAGTRQGETLGLTAGMIDRERGVIQIGYELQTLQDAPHKSLRARQLDGKKWLMPPKSSKGMREVPMVSPLRAVIEARMTQMGEDPWAPIVPAARGGFVDYSRDYKQWQQALADAGLPKIRVHDARHTTGTLLRAAGIEPRIIQTILGHNSAAMTEHYSHLGADEAAGAVAAFERLMVEG